MAVPISLLALAFQEGYSQWRSVEVSVSCGTTVATSECPPAGKRHILACGMGTVGVGVGVYPKPPEEAYHGLSFEWPEGVTIEAGIITDTNWVVIPGLVERMHLQRWHYRSDIYEDSLWKATGKQVSRTVRSHGTTRGGMFTFVAPEDLAGQEIFFTAIYTNDTLGTAAYSLPPSKGAAYGNRLLVVSPCSQKDRDRVIGSKIFYADMGGDYVTAVALADSLIPLGWRDLAGLDGAAHAAEYLGQPEKALQYIDLNFAANGRLYTLWSTGQASSSSEVRTYQRRRADIQRAIENQQQQH
ncbi:MAG: hypothetical protein NT025_05350 [bacterium]|nr:hypothetical protein [bacterium]